jgi:hypothetical protein
MGFRISAQTNIDQITRGLTRTQRKQIPFATSKSLNDIAFKARTLVINKIWPKAFQVRNRSFPKAAFRIRKSKKAPSPALATPAVLFDQLGRDYLKRHTTGGRKTARDGRHIAVPSSNLKRGAKGVRKGFRPREALDRDDTFKNRKGNAILQRQKGGKVKVLYVLTHSARIDKRFRFFEDIEKMYRARFPFIFARNLRNALRTAR